MESIQERMRVWKERNGRTIHFHLMDVATEYERLKAWLIENQPDVIIHFAEQRAAPFTKGEKPWQKTHPKKDKLQSLINLWWRLYEGGTTPLTFCQTAHCFLQNSFSRSKPLFEHVFHPKTGSNLFESYLNIANRRMDISFMNHQIFQPCHNP